MKIFSSKSRMTTLVLLLVWCMARVGTGQVAVSLTEVNVNKATAQHCYHITLTNQGSKTIALAGQNYRLYYNSETAMLSEATVKTLLPAQYTPLKLVQHHFDADASGFGVLPYEAHLGFINLATDLNLDAAKAISLKVGEPVAVAQMCFDASAGAKPEINWAQDDLTHTYATAFVELAMVDDQGITKKAPVNEYRVKTSEVSSLQEASVFTTKYFPNPFTEYLEITFNESLTSEATLSVKDIFGNNLTKVTLPKGINSYKLNGQDLPNGALLMEIKTSEGQASVMKAIKIR
jgi:Secretion system C-terminal sorting domain